MFSLILVLCVGRLESSLAFHGLVFRSASFFQTIRSNNNDYCFPCICGFVQTIFQESDICNQNFSKCHAVDPCHAGKSIARFVTCTIGTCTIDSSHASYRISLHVCISPLVFIAHGYGTCRSITYNSEYRVNCRSLFVLPGFLYHLRPQNRQPRLSISFLVSAESLTGARRRKASVEVYLMLKYHLLILMIRPQSLIR